MPTPLTCQTAATISDQRIAVQLQGGLAGAEEVRRLEARRLEVRRQVVRHREVLGQCWEDRNRRRVRRLRGRASHPRAHRQNHPRVHRRRVCRPSQGCQARPPAEVSRAARPDRIVPWATQLARAWLSTVCWGCAGFPSVGEKRPLDGSGPMLEASNSNTTCGLPCACTHQAHF